MGVSDEAVNAAWMAFTGRDLLGPAYADDADHMAEDERRDMHAALVAALPHMQPAGEAVGALRDALADMLSGWRYIRLHYGDLGGVGWDRAEQKAAEALATPPQPSAEPQQREGCPNCGRTKATTADEAAKGYCPKWWAITDADAERDCTQHKPQQEAQGAEESPPCSTHPEAPHGFDRTLSHSLDRYVCECEGWTPPATQPAPVDVRLAVSAIEDAIARNQMSAPMVFTKMRALLSAQPSADAGDGAMARDAARYRWLRDDGIDALPYTDYGLGPMFPNGESLDAAIDAAIAAQREAGEG